MGRTKIYVVLPEYIEEAKKLEVKYPLYMQCYKDALTTVLDNIETNNEIKDNRKNRKNYHGNGGEQEFFAVDNNIIAFIGGRGSGKTTAVTEFCEILCKYQSKRENWRKCFSDGSLDGLKDCFFHSLDSIDASILDKKEDLTEVIFANMYQAFEDVIKGRTDTVFKDRSQGLMKKFDMVYKEYQNIGKREEQPILGDSVIVKLKNTSSSLKLQRSIDELVSCFLEFLNLTITSDICCRMSSYLVITIDDLDMNLENGYKMLDQLQKYWRSQKVIILLVIKDEQMHRICEKHFVDCLVPEYGGTHKNVYTKFEEEARVLSDAYLLKVLPVSNRIYMPEAKLDSTARIIDNPELEKDGIEVKSYILHKIWVKMGLYYDAEGLKRHFCLPSTIRELVSYNDFLDSLLPMDKIRESDKFMVLYDQNHERFDQDIDHRMTVNLLNDEQRKIYRLISGRSLERRAKYAVAFLRLRMQSEENEEKKERLPDEVDLLQYSYADLLKVLYDLGRTDYMDKALVHCMLASFTSEMVREYYSYRYNKEQEAKKRSKERLECLLGDTFGGEWFQGIMPAIEFPEGSGFWHRMEGYIQKADLRDRVIILMFPSKGLLKNKSSACEHVIEMLTGVVSCLECFMMLYDNYRDKDEQPISFQWDFQFNFGKTEDGEYVELSINHSVVFADFDIFGFVGKDVEPLQGVHKEIVEKLTRCFYNFLLEKIGMDLSECKKFKNNLRRKIQAISPLEKMKNETDSGIKVFPYYNLDLSYNVMKRVRKRIQEDQLIIQKNVYHYFQKVYGYIAEELQKEDEYYKNSEKGFCEEFVKSPFIKTFGIQMDNAESSPDHKLRETWFGKALEQMMLGVTMSLEDLMEDQKID